MDTDRCLRLAVTLTLLTVAGCASETKSSAPPAPSPTVSAPAEPARSVETPVVPASPAASSAPASPTPGPAPSSPPEATFTDNPGLLDVPFDSGHTDLSRYGTEIMRQNAQWLLANSGYTVLIEGHSDYRGTREGNLVAAERRARTAMEFLVKAGVSAIRIQIVSRGSDHPVCPEKTEACAAKNRRVHFLVKPR